MPDNSKLNTPIFFISGWGFNSKILELSPLSFILKDKVFSIDAPPWSTPIDRYIFFIKEIKRRFGPVHLIGWSLGANIALKLTSIMACDSIKALWLLAVRRGYTKEDVKGMVHGIKKDYRAVLRAFYRKCFKGHDINDYRAFKDIIEDTLLEGFSQGSLITGLNYLTTSSIPVIIPPIGVKTIVINGRFDRIAPPSLAPEIAGGVNDRGYNDTFLYQKTLNCGHLPFLSREFMEVFLRIEKADTTCL